jgi:sulfur carrier protein
MMVCRINGQKITIDSPLTVGELLRQKDLKPEAVVVEYNGTIISRLDFDETSIDDGDRMEILSFVGGG